jgi:hypothetical protein
MRKIIILSAILFISFAVNAQLDNSRWSGAINIPSPVDCVLKFSSDTLYVLYAGNEEMLLADDSGIPVNATGKDSVAIEKMKFTISGDTLIVRKISGNSPCDNDSVGKYKYLILPGTLQFTKIDDPCDPRAGALSGVEFKKL